MTCPHHHTAPTYYRIKSRWHRLGTICLECGETHAILPKNE